MLPFVWFSFFFLNGNRLLFVCYYYYYLLFPKNVGKTIICVTAALKTTEASGITSHFPEASDLTSHFPGSTRKGKISFATH